MIEKVLLFLIRCYQRGISPFLGSHCRFSPSCSAYTYESIKTHGALRGIFLGVKRLLKCHPFHPGGYDPVPDPKTKHEIPNMKIRNMKIRKTKH